MESLVELSEVETKMIFVASCIESTARKLGISYQEMYTRMERYDMIDNYILPCYEVLHSESREQVTNNMIEYLNNREKAV